MTEALNVHSVVKAYDKKPVLNNLSFAAQKGEFIVLVGPSGCGKSTMLRAIAGLEGIDSGAIAIAGRDVTNFAPRDRNIAMVFQDYALYPHKTVYENIAFGLRIRKMPNDVIDKLVQEAAGKLNLQSFLNRKPAALSGGQRQRVAIGRAIVRSPDLFLFDEPLSNLDAKLRGSMRITINKLHKDLNATIVYVTHDQVEAMTLADKIIVLEGGRIQQMGRPLDLYYHPKNRFVAEFIGSPPMNLIAGELKEDGGWSFVSDHGWTLKFTEKHCARLNGGVKPGLKVWWGARAENFRLAADADESKPMVCFKAFVDVTEPLGAVTSVYCRVNDHELHVSLPEPHRPKAGEDISLAWQSSHLYLFDHQTGLSLTS